jgi:LmbE family N-acetylglucosaminyl deacetylase
MDGMEQDEMMSLKLSLEDPSPRVLFLGAHSDDIEIGCGGTVLKLIREHKRISCTWVVFSSNERRRKEAMASAAAFLAKAGRRTVIVKGFKDGFFPGMVSEIKKYFEMLKRRVDPDLIFTHQRSDLHQDHRLISDLTWNTFRDHSILEYEIPKYDADLRAPNVFAHLDKETCDKKIENLLKHFRSQAGNHWYTEETFRSILRLRGIESNSPAGYAEGFYGRKLILL